MQACGSEQEPARSSDECMQACGRAVADVRVAAVLLAALCELGEVGARPIVETLGLERLTLLELLDLLLARLLVEGLGGARLGGALHGACALELVRMLALVELLDALLVEQLPDQGGVSWGVRVGGVSWGVRARGGVPWRVPGRQVLMSNRVLAPRRP
jgi:hypothetical protein